MTPIQDEATALRSHFPTMSDAEYAVEALAGLDLDGAQPFTLGHIQRAAYELRDQYAGRDWARNFVWVDWEHAVYEVIDLFLPALNQKDTTVINANGRTITDKVNTGDDDLFDTIAVGDYLETWDGVHGTVAAINFITQVCADGKARIFDADILI